MAVHGNTGEISSLVEKDLLIWSTIREVLKHFEENYKSHEENRKIAGVGQIPNDSLIALDDIFGETLEKALELVETSCIKFYHINSKSIGIFQVYGSLQSSYIVFPLINYCSCFAYKYQVAAGSLLTCKHVLASAIAKIIHRVELVEVKQAVIKMNKREDWQDQNQYMQHSWYPQSEIPQGIPQANNWVHVPPQTMPWGLPTNSHPPVVRFTAGDIIPQHHPVKRKINIDFEMRPTKQLVTEEKMAAHMSNLHISDVELPCLNAEDEAMDTDRLPKLIVCDEVKNMKTEPLIPESLLNKIERPKMAVVLWQPPGNDLVSKLTELKKENGKANEKEEKEEHSMIIENNNVDNTFRPIDPVPMHPAPQKNFLQPTPQFHNYYPFL